MTSVDSRPIVLIGAVAVDAIHLPGPTPDRERVELRYGGVCHNAACALGVLGLMPRLVTARFTGELGETIPSHLADFGVQWCPVSKQAPLCFFEAVTDAEWEVRSARFVDGGAVAVLSPDVLGEHEQALSGAGTLLACTDLTTASLKALRVIASQHGAEYWLLTSDVQDVSKLHAIRPSPDVVSLNLAELCSLTGKSLTSRGEIAEAGRELVDTGGVCLVTLGAHGMMLCQSEVSGHLFQPIVPIKRKCLVSAGDVAFACLLARRRMGDDWEDALHFAAEATAAYLQSDCCGVEKYRSLISPDTPLPPVEKPT